MKASGRVFKYGGNINTDVIIPARYLSTSDPKELAMHYMEDIDSGSTEKVEKGGIITASKSFGCGSSGEHAPVATKESGVSCIIASTLARIFYGNAINIGSPIIEYEEAAKSIDTGDKLEIGSTTGVINNKSKKQEYKGGPFPEFMQEAIDSNGLVDHIKSEKVRSEEGRS